MSPSRESHLFDRVEKGEVAKIFKDVIFLERELESAKIELCLKPDFNMIDAFRMLDLNSKGEITQAEMLDSLNHNLQLTGVSQDDAYLFFRRYDLS